MWKFKNSIAIDEDRNFKSNISTEKKNKSKMNFSPFDEIYKNINKSYEIYIKPYFAILYIR